jgi:hypothetical protein
MKIVGTWAKYSRRATMSMIQETGCPDGDGESAQDVGYI